LGEHEYGIEQGRLYLKANPADAATRIMVAQSLVRLGKLDDAYEELQMIPEEARDLESRYAIGRLQMARGDWKDARVTLLSVHEERRNEYDILRSLMLVEGRLEMLGESVARIEEAIEAEPENARLMILRGEVALATGDLEAAEKAYKRAIELEPEGIAAYSQLASLYQQMGRLDETIEAYKKALEVRPDNSRIHHVLGVLYEYRGNIDPEMEQYELAIAHDPSLGDAKNNLAYLLAERGETLDRALDLAQEAKALLPDSPNTADTLGWVLYKRGVASAAVGYLREAEAGMNPEDQSIGVVRHHLALAYEENGESDKAIESLDRALAGMKPNAEGDEPGWASDVRTMRERLASTPAG
jgi:tetratricopeptide (TPR) repeat protein